MREQPQRPPSAGPPRPQATRAATIRRTAAFATFLLITVAVTLLRGSLPDLGRLGYFGAFVVSLMGSATIVLPIPGLAVTFALGGTLPHPVLVGLAAGLGETLGELTGYLAGYSGRAIVEDRDRYDQLALQMQRHGSSFIFLLAAIPNPAFDLAGIAAGTLRFPVSRFLLACWPGKTIKTTLVALAGAGLLPGLSDWISQLLS